MGLESVSQNMRSNIQSSSGMFGPQMGNNPFQQSGKALEIQVDQGNEGKEDYFNALVIAYERTAQILINAYPKLITNKRQVRLLNQDGTFDMAMLNDVIVDKETGERVEINNLTQGIYDVTYDVGQGYKNQQQETVDAFLRMGEVDPSFIARGQDIMVNQFNAPGMSDMHERIREQMVLSGQIPQSQLTDDEKAKVQQIADNQQNQQPSPEQQIGQAAVIEAQTKERTAGFKEQEAIANNQIAQKKLAQEDRKLDQSEFQLMSDRQQQQTDELTAVTTQMANLTKALGIDGVVTPESINVLRQQLAIVDQKQDEVEALQ